jgi:hypothetical protein
VRGEAWEVMGVPGQTRLAGRTYCRNSLGRMFYLLSEFYLLSPVRLVRREQGACRARALRGQGNCTRALREQGKSTRAGAGRETSPRVSTRH